MNKLTCIIPFLNEGIEIFRTVKSIRDTAGDTVDIILINDASTDNVDYSVVATYFNCRYIKNKERQGVAGSRDIGVSLATTPYCLLLDGHMRFYDTTWVDTLLAEVSKNTRKIYCTACVMLWWPYTGRGPDLTHYSNGAYLATSFKDWSSSIDPKWIPHKFVDSTDVPIVLGANYCFATEYYKELRGLEGLKYYGCDETWLSLKSWAIGDGCAVIPSVKIGHVFREKHTYPIYNQTGVSNRLLIILTLFPEKSGWTHHILNKSGDALLTDMKENADLIVCMRKWFLTKEQSGWRERFNNLNKKFLKEGSHL